MPVVTKEVLEQTRIMLQVAIDEWQDAASYCPDRDDRVSLVQQIRQTRKLIKQLTPRAALTAEEDAAFNYIANIFELEDRDEFEEWFEDYAAEIDPSLDLEKTRTAFFDLYKGMLDSVKKET